MVAQSEHETTQMMGASFQKDAQQRLELKQAKAKMAAQESEIQMLTAELADARADCTAARKRIKEVRSRVWRVCGACVARVWRVCGARSGGRARVASRAQRVM